MGTRYYESAKLQISDCSIIMNKYIEQNWA